MVLITIVNGIINQLMTWGAPPCRMGGFLKSWGTKSPWLPWLSLKWSKFGMIWGYHPI